MKQTFAPVTNVDRLIETQKPDAVHYTRHGIELEWRELTGKPELATSQQRLAQDIKLGLRKYMAISTPKLNSLGDAFQRMVQRAEDAADGVHKKMAETGDYVENAVTKFAGGADYIHGLAKQIDDTANQMIGGNGGPPLSNSTNSSTG